MKSNIQELINTKGYVEFWDANDFMSNFFQSKIVYKGRILYCSEQLFMIKKAELFNQPKYVDKLIKAGGNGVHPMVYKKLGREVPGWDIYGSMWEDQRYDVMVDALTLKFSDPTLKEMLLNTGDKVLIEASKFDRIWGIGLPKGNKNVSIVNNWKGQNLLGFALMEVRSKIK